MEISVKDLIVPAKRAGEDLRSLVSQIAAPSALNKVDAFNELLNRSSRPSEPDTIAQRDHGQRVNAERREDKAPNRPEKSAESASKRDPQRTSQGDEVRTSVSDRAPSDNPVDEPQKPDGPIKAGPAEDTVPQGTDTESSNKGETVTASLVLPPAASEIAVAKVTTAPATNPLSKSKNGSGPGFAQVAAQGQTGPSASGNGNSNALLAPNQDSQPTQGALVSEQKKSFLKFANFGSTDGVVATAPASVEPPLPSNSAIGAPARAVASKPAAEPAVQLEAAPAAPVKPTRPDDHFLAGARLSVTEDDTATSPRSLRTVATSILAAQEIGGGRHADASQGASANIDNGSKNATKPGQSSVPALNTQQVPPNAIGITTAVSVDTEVTSSPAQVRPANIIPVYSSSPVAGGPDSAGLRGTGSGFPAAANRGPAAIPVTIDQVSIHIARAAAAGSDHINIKLKPASLGQVDVRMELTHDGRVTAVITADRSDTLDLLQRDARSLEKALADAGLKTDQGALQFSLRGEQGSHSAFEQFANRHAGVLEGRGSQPGSDVQTELTDHFGDYHNARARNGGVDIRV